MKAKSFFSIIMIAAVISACSKEVLRYPNDKEPVENGYLVLILKNASVRKAAGSSVDHGSILDNKINSLTVALTDASGNIEFVKTPSVKNGITEEFKVAPGDYYIYALVNSQIPVSAGQNINQVITAASETDAVFGYNNGSFLMVNQRSTSSGQAGVYTIINNSNTQNMPAIATIYVDRVACKIIDDTDYEKNPPSISLLADVTGNFIDGINIYGFALLNVSKRFNLIQTWDPFNLQGISLDAEILSTPLYNNNFAADQYFCTINKYTHISKDINNNITGITDITAGVDNLFGKGPVYTTENRPAIINIGNCGITASRNETTGVIYKVQARSGGADLGTFYRYNNVLTDNIEDIQELPEFSNKNLSVLGYPTLRALGIQVYENGIMYYSYFIRDHDMAHLYEDNYYYAVFRNSTYKLNIYSISALGDDVPGGVVSEYSPIDTEEACLNVSLEANPWVLNTINITL